MTFIFSTFFEIYQFNILWNFTIYFIFNSITKLWFELYFKYTICLIIFENQLFWCSFNKAFLNGVLKVTYFNQVLFKYLKEIFISFFYITPFCLAVKNGNVDIIKFLLSNERIDVNKINILIFILFSWSSFNFIYSIL